MTPFTSLASLTKRVRSWLFTKEWVESLFSMGPIVPGLRVHPHSLSHMKTTREWKTREGGCRYNDLIIQSMHMPSAHTGHIFVIRFVLLSGIILHGGECLLCIDETDVTQYPVVIVWFPFIGISHVRGLISIMHVERNDMPSIVHLSCGVKDYCLHHLLARVSGLYSRNHWIFHEWVMRKTNRLFSQRKHSFFVPKYKTNRLLLCLLFSSSIGESPEPVNPTIWCRIPSRRIQSRIRTWIPTFTQLWDASSVAWFATTQASSWPWPKAPNRPFPSANINSKIGAGTAPPRTSIAGAISSERSSIEVKHFRFPPFYSAWENLSRAPSDNLRI